MADSGRLTTHVLDTAHGRPAAGMAIDLYLAHGDHTHHLLTAHTNADGRVDQPLLAGEDFDTGTYELHFHVGRYFSRLGLDLENGFLDVVPVRFMMAEATHYHVPLLVSPFGYTTYRGS